jgi:polyribonucleotide nucleotidyltransferase
VCPPWRPLCQFSVDPALLGMVIGQGGAHVRRVTEETGVDRVVVDREAGVVRIVGHRAADVARARAALEVCSISVRVPEDRVGYIVGKEGKNSACLSLLLFCAMCLSHACARPGCCTTPRLLSAC